MRYNPPPGWPPAPEGFTPEPGWEPDPSWPPAPPGWQLWINDDQPAPPGPSPLPSYPGTALPSHPAVAWSGGVHDPRVANTTSGWAVASLVLGIVGGAVLAAIFGFVALGKIRDTGQKGRSMAIAGIILSGVWVVVAVVAVAAHHGATGVPTAQVSTNPGNGGPAPGQLPASGSVSVHALVVGQCFDWSQSTQPVVSVTLIPCGQAHNAQVFAVWDLSGSTYPANVLQVAAQGCAERKASLSASASSLEVTQFSPGAAGWADGDRVVYCFILSPTPNLNSSLVNSP